MLQDYLAQLESLADQKGIKLEAAADAAGMARTTIWRARTGRHVLSQQTAKKLAEAIERLSREQAA